MSEYFFSPCSVPFSRVKTTGLPYIDNDKLLNERKKKNRWDNNNAKCQAQAKYQEWMKKQVNRKSLVSITLFCHFISPFLTIFKRMTAFVRRIVLFCFPTTIYLYTSKSRTMLWYFNAQPYDKQHNKTTDKRGKKNTHTHAHKTIIVNQKLHATKKYNNKIFEHN